jgi:hypothetical protein
MKTCLYIKETQKVKAVAVYLKSYVGSTEKDGKYIFCFILNL